MQGQRCVEIHKLGLELEIKGAAQTGKAESGGLKGLGSRGREAPTGVNAPESGCGWVKSEPVRADTVQP